VKQPLGLAKLLDKTLGTLLCYLLAPWAWLQSRFQKPLHSPQKILVEKLVAVGDVLLVLPTLRALRRRFPDATIVMLTTPRVRDVIEGCPDIDDILYYDLYGKEKGLPGFFSMVRRIRERHFDLVLELTHYHRIVSLVTFTAGIPHRAGFALPGQGRNRLLTIPVLYDTKQHEVETFLDVARAVGATETNPSLVPIAVSEDDKRVVRELLAAHSIPAKSLILIQPGTSAIALSRRWGNDKWASVANGLHSEFSSLMLAFCGGPDEVDIFKAIEPQLQFQPLNFIGRLTLKQLAWLMTEAVLYIGLDTGTTHLAAAMGTTVLALYGPNTPAKWGPYGTQHHVIYKALPCSPCTKQYLGQVSTCQNNICMQTINTEDVLSEARKIFTENLHP
jgi:heptosyltransferase-2